MKKSFEWQVDSGQWLVVRKNRRGGAQAGGGFAQPAKPARQTIFTESEQMGDEIQVIVNGEARSLLAGASVQDLLESLGVSTKLVAVELNRRIIKRDTYAATTLNAGDVVEVVQFVGGG
ncbi:MAG: sulfur carrier protein ThiS [Pseudomonadota bacterium]